MIRVPGFTDAFDPIPFNCVTPMIYSPLLLTRHSSPVTRPFETLSPHPSSTMAGLVF